MKNKIFLIIIAAFIFGISACQSPEDLAPSVSHNGINSLKAFLLDDDSENNNFVGEIDYANRTITIVCPYNYPKESDNLFPTDKLVKMRMEAGLDNNVYITPSLLYMDLTKENYITVTLQNKEQAQYKVVCEIRKNNECAITQYNIPSLEFHGIINEENKTISLISTDPVGTSLAEVIVSHGATISPDPTTETLNYDEPFNVTVTAQNGKDKATYAVRVVEPNKLPQGMRKGSGKLIWSKALGDMGINGTDNNTVAIASSSDYLFVNTRNSDLKYFNRNTGEYVGTINLPFKSSLANFCIASDVNNNLLITNLRNTGGGAKAVQTIYRITGTGEPQKYIETSHIYPTGRKLSVCGNLDGDAIILSTVEVSSNVLYWEVKNGVLQSQEPNLFTADPAVIGWNYLGDAVTFGTDLSQGIFCVGYGTQPRAFGFFNPDGSKSALYDLANVTVEGAPLNDSGHILQQLDIAEFNGARYIAVADQFWNYNTYGLLYDVTVPGNLAGDPKDPNLFVYQTNPIWNNSNGNNVADINLRVSTDGMKMTLYLLGTNGGVAAYEFDCIDVEHLVK